MAIYPILLGLRFLLTVIFALSSILALGISNNGLAFLSIYLFKSTYTILHICKLLPLMLRNFSIAPKSSYFKCGPCESGGNVLACSSFLVSKNVRRRGPLKLETEWHLLFWHFLFRAKLSIIRRYSRYTHCAWNSYTAVDIIPASVPVCVYMYTWFVHPATSTLP